MNRCMFTRGKSRFLYGFIEVSKCYDLENTVYGRLKNIGHFDVLYRQEKFYGSRIRLDESQTTDE